MKCPNCGRETRGRFCTNCGTRMPEAQGSPAEPLGSAGPDGAAPDATMTMRPADASAISSRLSGQSGPEAASASGTEADDVPVPGQGERAEPAYAAPGLSSRPPESDTTITFSQPADDRYGGRLPAAAAPSDSGTATAMRPMSLGDVITGTFDILRSRLQEFLGVGLAYAAAMFVAFAIFFLVAWGPITSGDLGSSILSIVIGGLILLAVFVVTGTVAAIAYIDIARGVERAAGNDLLSRTAAILQRSWVAFPRVFLALLLLVGVDIGVAIGFSILGAILGPLGPFVRLAGEVVNVWLGINLLFVLQIALLEHASPVDALGRSMRLVAGYWWRTFGYSLVGAALLIPLYIAGIILVVIVAAVFHLVPFLDAVVVGLLVAALFSMLFAFYITYVTLMYMDLRARKTRPEQATAAAQRY